MITQLDNFWNYLWCFSWQLKHLEFDTLKYKIQDSIGSKIHNYETVSGHLVQGDAFYLKIPMSITFQKHGLKADDFQ